MTLSEKIIKLRKENGLSQEEFGNEINVSRQAVSKWENGESKPDIEKIQQICKKYNISYNYLLDDSVDNYNIEKTEPTKRNSLLKRIIKLIIVILIIYLVVFTYKLLMYVRINMVANSFSEENFSVVQNLKTIDSTNSTNTMVVSTTKINGQIISKVYINNNEYPTFVNYINTTTGENYKLIWDNENNKYIYSEPSDINNDDIDRLPVDIVNSYYPKEVLTTIIFSLNPTIIILPNGTQIHYSINNKLITNLNKVGLLETTISRSITGEEAIGRYTYNYTDWMIESNYKNPLEEYKDLISNK